MCFSLWLDFFENEFDSELGVGGVCGAAGGWCCDVTSYVTDTPPLWFEVHQGSLGMHQKTCIKIDDFRTLAQA